MKYWKQQSPKRLVALYLALNWALTDREDELRIPAWEAELASTALIAYTQEEVEEHLAQRYVGCFRTKRLRKKHDEVLARLEASRRNSRKEGRAA